jgi:hypothetical protein
VCCCGGREEEGEEGAHCGWWRGGEGLLWRVEVKEG